MKPTLLHSLNAFPPFLIRTLARTSGWYPKRLSKGVLKRKSGLPMQAVIRISHLATWDSVTVAEAEAFARACGADLRRLDWVRRSLREELLKPLPFGYLGRKEAAWFHRMLSGLSPSHPLLAVLRGIRS